MREVLNMIHLKHICFGLFVLFSRHCDAAPPPCYEKNDATLRDCENGSAIVEAVLAKFDCLQVFGRNHIFMQRIAFVESDYGQKPPCDENGGGMWRLKKETFDMLFEPPVRQIIRNEIDTIQARSGVNFSDTRNFQYTSLTKPFYSGLAARLYLHYLNKTSDKGVPFNGNIQEQAEFWVNNYTMNTTSKKDFFINKVTSLGKYTYDGPPPCYERHDATLRDCENGSAIVDAVLAKFDCLKIFGCNHIFMQRIAFVESDYGQKPPIPCDKNGGGMWRLKKESFDMLFKPPVRQIIRNEIDIIQVLSGVNFSDTRNFQYTSLTKPFYSGLAARLYLHYLNKTSDKGVPFNGNIQEQAEFWVNNYTMNTTSKKDFFINKVTSLDYNCKINADILFLVDKSGSITEYDFKKVRTFLNRFVTHLKLGPQDDQVGIVTFSNYAEVEFSLNQHNTLNDLNYAIGNISNSQGWTNLAEGICHLRDRFRVENGARPGSAAEVYRVAIVLTDGRPNHEIKHDCRVNDSTYIEEIDELHELQPPVDVYVIGVGDKIDNTVLEIIASKPPCEYVTHLDYFDQLPNPLEGYIYDICKRVSMKTKTNQNKNFTLDRNENMRCNFEIPVNGLTLEVCVSEGHVQVYGSVTIPNPSSVYYNWWFEVGHKEGNGNMTCLAYFFEINNTTTPSESTKITTRDTSSSSDPSTDVNDRTLYISVVGLDDHNRFTMNGARGNNCNETRCVGDPPDPPSPPRPSDRKVIFTVTAVVSGLVLIVSIVLIFLLVQCYIVYHRNKKNKKEEDQYSLLSETIDYVSFDT